jgi:hypothetical protein
MLRSLTGEELVSGPLPDILGNGLFDDPWLLESKPSEASTAVRPYALTVTRFQNQILQLDSSVQILVPPPTG